MLKLRLRESEVPERGTGIVWGQLDLNGDSYGEFDSSIFSTACDLLEIVWAEEYIDFCNTLRVVVPRRAPDGWHMDGFTVSSYQGAVWIGAQDLVSVFEALVHEQSHVKHRYIEEAIPLLAERQKADKFWVGWRTDPRPIEGIYEGVYVNVHCCRALFRLLQHSLLSAEEAELAQTRYVELRQQTREGTALLEKHARFTQAGESFLEWARQAVRSEPMV